MSSKQERDERKRQDDEQDRQEARRLKEAGLLEDIVADGVMSALGRPPGFLRADASSLGEGRYRVNVFVGADAGAARVAHSYFVEADGDGKILASDPAIKREYGPTTPA